MLAPSSAPAPALPLAPNPAPAAAQATPFHIPSLDGLRALSFLIVFVAHAGLEHQVPGGFGVTVFFFLSGYLITTLMRMEHEQTGRVNFGQFYLRRALRILPPFYLVLTAATLLTAWGVLGGKLERGAVVAQALHYANYWIVQHGYDGQALGTGVYWSLAVEEHFYFVFPALFVLLAQRGLDGRKKAWVFWALCAAVLAWRVVLVLSGSPPDRTYVASDTRVDSILFGCALAVHHNPVLDTRAKTASPLWRYGLFPLGLGGLLVSFLYRDPTFRETWRYSLQGLSLYPLFRVAIAAPNFGPLRLLNLKPVTFVGTLSYSLYLVHHVVLYALGLSWPHAHGLVRGVLALGLSLGLAWVIYQWVERPCAKLRRRLSAPRSS